MIKSTYQSLTNVKNKPNRENNQIKILIYQIKFVPLQHKFLIFEDNGKSRRKEDWFARKDFGQEE